MMISTLFLCWILLNKKLQIFYILQTELEKPRTFANWGETKLWNSGVVLLYCDKHSYSVIIPIQVLGLSKNFRVTLLYFVHWLFKNYLHLCSVCFFFFLAIATL